LNAIEVQSPGSKAAFYFSFVDRVAPRFAAETVAARDDLATCASCGAPTTGDVCAFCKLVERTTAPVTLRSR
jgi:recombinational DNA repair protein RecR